MTFLPIGYQPPKSTNSYLKLQDGENKIRILTAPILGWEDWVDKKPVRYPMHERPKPVDGKKPVKHFWSFVVWNYKEEEIQIMHVTQTSIRNCIQALCNDSDWGAPYTYDIKIIRSGEGMETEYTVNPLPHKPVPAAAVDRFYEKRCNLDAIYHNEDPFNSDWKTHTEPMFQLPAAETKKKKKDLVEVNTHEELFAV